MHIDNDNEQLSEEYIQDSFHSYLKSSLAQAKAERLLDAQILGSAEADLMITGPALCLYFAALRSTTLPPSVPLPRNNKSSTHPPTELSTANCPPPFVPFLRVWASTVPHIQSLPPEHQHDLARLICGLDPIARPPEPSLNGIAADLRAVAIEISQRRSFQERYSGDLQAAIDAGEGAGGSGGVKVRASFVPPPVYEASPTSPTGPSPRTFPSAGAHPHPSSQSHPPPRPARIHTHLAPPTVLGSATTPSSATRTHFPRSPSPTILPSTSPAIDLIRETLYASLGDILSRNPTLHRLLHADPSRAYFACVSLAVLDVATTALTPDGGVVGVLGRELTLEECPPELRPLMRELGAVGRMAREVEEEDTMRAVEAAERGEDVGEPRMERVVRMLEGGVGAGRERGEGEEEGERRRSLEGRAVAFANRINTLALRMKKLRAFKERQKEVFQVLEGVGA